MPVLLAQCRRSGRAKWAILGFLASSVVLLVVSWALVLTPGIPWRWRGHKSLGVPVKDYIMQSVIFAICAFGLLGQAPELWRVRALRSLALFLVALAFIANIAYVATARTTLVVMAVLLLLFSRWPFLWYGAPLAALSGRVATGRRCDAS